MMNKKALGLHWYIAALAFIISMGILAWGNINTKIPLVGEFSAATAHALENGNNIPLEVESIMNQLNREANLGYEKHKVFALDSYCNDIFDGDKDGITQENTKYKDRLLAANLGFKTPKSGEPSYFTAREEVKCYAAEEEFTKYYEEAFNAEYRSFKSATWKNLNLDFSSTNYKSEVIKEENGIKKYFNILKTDSGFLMPITIKDKSGIKNIGSFTIKPNFKLETPNPANRPFDGHEVCIFAADCGATCKDVLERNPNSNFKIVENAVPALRCEAYYDCKEPLDQFGKAFSCSKESGTATNNPILCKGQCISFCSVSSVRVDDADASTKCTKYSCGNYWSCRFADLCGCPDPSNPSFDNACGGLNCDTLNCDSDSEFENERKITTQCLDSCNKYGDCSSTSLCACDFDLSACHGSCYCNPKEWKKTGGCGDATENGIDCDWNEKPQKREYNPNTCSSPDYKCELQPSSECINPEPAPTPAPTPTPADNSCQGRCGSQAPAGCWCDNQCTIYGDCCSDYSQYC